MTDDFETPGADRRDPRHPQLTPTALLEGLPTLVVLDRLAVPVLALDGDTIVFANTAFADLLGTSATSLHGSSMRDLLTDPLAPGEMASSRCNSMVRFAHADGFAVRAFMSRSMLVRAEDTVTLVTFVDATDRLWETEPI